MVKVLSQYYQDNTKIIFRLGGGGGGDKEVIDLVEEGKEEEVDSEDGDNDDEVTETGLAQSEPGKQPVFHHEIYPRLVRLMNSQGAYSKKFRTLSSQKKR